MNRLSPIRFAVALGTAAALFYLACMIFMGVAAKDTVVWVFNCLMHGVDVGPIARDGVPIAESIAGLIMTWIGGAIFGWLAAWAYNFGTTGSTNDRGGAES